jgi:ubiquinone/menaquinone biosynthesis C-methylase UbiE
MIIFDRWRILRSLAIEPILDVGCHVGEMFGEHAINVDIHSLDDKRKESGDPNLIIPTFINADANHLPFKDQSFTTVVLGELLEHMDDPIATLNEAQRVGKMILISLPNEFQWSEDKKPFTHYDHKTNFDEQKVFDLVLKSGLILIEYYKVIYQGWSYFILHGISKNLEKGVIPI